MDSANVGFMTPVTVDAATPADLDAFVASVDGLFHEDGGRYDPHLELNWPTAAGGPHYAGLLDDDSCLLAVARGESGQVIGHLVGKLAGPDDLRTCRFAILESIRVDPAARGAGVGSELIRHFFGRAAGKGAEIASVSAFVANADAQRSTGDTDSTRRP
jgi:ribosomal protein S18 acetylase RimI-like enzyme